MLLSTNKRSSGFGSAGTSAMPTRSSAAVAIHRVRNLAEFMMVKWFGTNSWYFLDVWFNDSYRWVDITIIPPHPGHTHQYQLVRSIVRESIRLQTTCNFHFYQSKEYQAAAVMDEDGALQAYLVLDMEQHQAVPIYR